MKSRRLIAIGLAVFASAVVVSAPATLMDAVLERISRGKLRLVEAQGTLWSGAGRIEIRDPGGRAGVAKDLAWRMLPESLLRGHLVCDVRMEQGAEPFPVTISLSRIELANADIRLPATALGLGVPKLAPLGLTGELWLHVDDLAIEAERTRGRVTMQWRDAGSVLTPIAPLGDYELKLDGEGAMVQAVLRTLQGPLQIDGKGAWASGANPDFLAVARVSPQHERQLGPLLRLIAVERSAGSFELQIK